MSSTITIGPVLSWTSWPSQCGWWLQSVFIPDLPWWLYGASDSIYYWNCPSSHYSSSWARISASGWSVMTMVRSSCRSHLSTRSQGSSLISHLVSLAQVAKRRYDSDRMCSNGVWRGFLWHSVYPDDNMCCALRGLSKISQIRFWRALFQIDNWCVCMFVSV